MKLLPVLATFAVLATTVAAQTRETNWVASPSRPEISVARIWWANWPVGTWRGQVDQINGARLASFETQDEELLLGSTLLGNSPWIGLTRSGPADPWTWETGKILNYGLNLVNVASSDTTAYGYVSGGIRYYDARTSTDTRAWALIEVEYVDCDGNNDHDSWEIFKNKELDWDKDWQLDTCEEQGTIYCGSSNPNSTGQLGGIRALGRTTVASNDLILYATKLPPGKFGYWLASQSTANIPGFGGSMGTLCLGAPQIRFNVHPKYGIWTVPSNGRVETILDLTDIPQVGSIKAGETWHFQAWHRDIVGSTLTSNTTDALMITFV